MKRIIAFMLIIACVLGVIGCDFINSGEDREVFSIIATNFPLYDFTRQIIKDVQGLEVRMLLPFGAESHDFEPTPQDIIEISDCDLILYIGGESDAWVEKVLNSIDNEINTLKLMDFADLEEEPEAIISDDSHDEHDHEHEADEHIWTSIANAKRMVQAITDKLSESDKLNSLSYKLNCEHYLQQLDALDQEFKEVIAQGNKKPLVFADRFPFVYFAKYYGLDYIAAFPGCAAEVEASAATVAELINCVKSEQIGVVFYIEFSNQRLADTVVEATGAKKLLFHTAHNVSKEEFENGITYIQIMENNLRALKEALI